MIGFRLAVSETRFRECFFVAGFVVAFPLSAELVVFTIASPCALREEHFTTGALWTGFVAVRE